MSTLFLVAFVILSFGFVAFSWKDELHKNLPKVVSGEIKIIDLFPDWKPRADGYTAYEEMDKRRGNRG